MSWTLYVVVRSPLLTKSVHSLHEAVCFSSLLPRWVRVLWRFSLLDIESMTYLFYLFQSLFLFEMRANQLPDHLSPPYWSAVINLIIFNLLDLSVSWIHFHLDINKCKYVKLTSLLENAVIKWHISNPRANWIQSRVGDFTPILWVINIPMDF